MTKTCKLKCNNDDLVQTSAFLRAVGDETRLRILCFLRKDTRCVCDIIEFLNLPQNLVSHHLKVLKQKKILLSQKQGLNIFYSLNYGMIKHNIDFFNFLIQ